MQFSGCSLEFGVDSGCSLVDAVWNSERPSGCSKWMQFRFRSGRVDAASGCTSVFGVSRVDAIASTSGSNAFFGVTISCIQVDALQFSE